YSLGVMMADRLIDRGADSVLKSVLSSAWEPVLVENMNLDDSQTRECVLVERAFLMRLGGGCQVPMAAYCEPCSDGVRLEAAVTHPDGQPIYRDSYTGPLKDYSLGVMMADRLIDRGADSVLKSVLSSAWEPVLVENMI
ncbi:MAG: hypothetical protein M1511_03875, partial [Deltaproteobacteria bacterium]|nr:hypothetical protein [Deltaproteobacteria bacterium]